jgi:hypothetical protein
MIKPEQLLLPNGRIDSDRLEELSTRELITLREGDGQLDLAHKRFLNALDEELRFRRDFLAGQRVRCFPQ